MSKGDIRTEMMKPMQQFIRLNVRRILLSVSTGCVLFLIASCDDSQGATPRVVTQFTADASCEAQTRTYVSGTDVLWSQDDAIAVYGGDATEPETFTLTNGAGTASAVFSGEIEQATCYGAVYPYGAVTACELSPSNASFTVTIPNEQTATPGSFGPGENVSVAFTTNESLIFRNVCGYMGVYVTDNDVTSLTISDSNKNLTGSVKVNCNEQGITSTTRESGFKNVTLTGPLNAGNTYYIPVIPGTYERVSVRFLHTDGKTTTFTSNAFIEVERTKRSNIFSGSTAICQLTLGVRTDDDDVSTGGHIEIDGKSVNSYRCQKGTEATLTAKPATGYEFDAWQQYNGSVWMTLTTPASYTFTINEDTQLRAKFKKHTIGPTDKIVLNTTDDIVLEPYSGKTNSWDANLWGGMASHEGGDVYGDTYFSFNYKSYFLMVDLNDANIKQETTGGIDNYCHCNNVNFSSARYAESDEFPLFYTSAEDPSNTTVPYTYVCRINKDINNKYSYQAKQTIYFPQKGTSEWLYYPNMILDEQDSSQSYLWIGGYKYNSYSKLNNDISGNTYKYYRFNLPTQPGQLGAQDEVTMTMNDINYSIDTQEMLETSQGAFIKDGYIFQVFGHDNAHTSTGVGVDSYNLAKVVVTSITQKRIVMELILSDVRNHYFQNYGDNRYNIKMNLEPESLFLYDKGDDKGNCLMFLNSDDEYSKHLIRIAKPTYNEILEMLGRANQ